MLCDCEQTSVFQLLHLIKYVVLTLRYLSVVKFIISWTDNIVLFYRQEFVQHSLTHVIQAAPSTRHMIHSLLRSYRERGIPRANIQNLKKVYVSQPWQEVKLYTPQIVKETGTCIKDQWVLDLSYDTSESWIFLSRK